MALFVEDDYIFASSSSCYPIPDRDNKNRHPPLHAPKMAPLRRRMCYTGSQALHVPDYQRPDIRVIVVVNVINVNVVGQRMLWGCRMDGRDVIRREGT